MDATVLDSHRNLDADALVAVAALGTLFLRDQTELWIQLGASIATGLAIWGLIAV